MFIIKAPGPSDLLPKTANIFQMTNFGANIIMQIRSLGARLAPGYPVLVTNLGYQIITPEVEWEWCKLE
jgi:hypothetical protein